MAEELDIETKLLKITREFLLELGTDRPQTLVTLDTSLERDLGIGSLERVEFFSRVEKVFAIRFSDAVIARTKNLRELIPVIAHAKPKIKRLGPTSKLEVIDTLIDMSSAKTLTEVLERYATLEPQRPHIYLLNEENKENIIRFGQLYESAKSVARGLVAHGLQQGETVALMLPTSENFFFAFFGVLLAGGIPVPIYPPFRPDQIEDYAKREAGILSNAGVRILITFREAERLSKLLRNFIPSLKEVTTIEELMSATGELPSLSLSGEDPALIQYTSGSTSEPKGVLLSHNNLLANLRAVGQSINLSPQDRVVSWLPLYHDMGLIGTWLGSLYYGITATIMAPQFFLNRPERWLWAIHYFRGTVSAAPNFAYDLCVRKISESSIEGLDLSSWRLALNGAEAVYPKTLERFYKKFAPYGLKQDVLFPVYGLAESSVALTFPEVGHIYRVDKIKRDIFETEQRAEITSKENKNTLEFVSSGKPLPKHDIRIVDEADQPLPERIVGNVQFKGPSSMCGYYRNPEATQGAYHEGWWSTGDLGYVANNDLFITGRKKDIIIKAGRNLHAAELEAITSQVEGVRRGCVAAFGINDPERGTERLIVVAETNLKDSATKNHVITEVSKKITADAGIPPDRVVLVPPKSIPKTSSGKLRRSACKDLYLQGKLGKKGRPAWMQFIRLFTFSLGKNIIWGVEQAGKIIYTLYYWFIFLLFLFPLWILIQLLPHKTAAKCTKLFARNILRVTGCPVKIHGKEKLKSTEPMVYVANHSSYIDALLLMGVLPFDVAFIGKKELLKVPVVKTFIKKLGYLTVDRLDFSQSMSDTQSILQLLQSGRSIVIFPEGTFTYATGLRPFKLGAFKLAVEADCAICPVAIHGTRTVWRASSYLRPGFIEVTIGEIMKANDKDWSEMVRLRTAARSEIAKYCGEPAIDLIAAGVPVE